MTYRVVTGDALETLKTLPSESASCCATSPPYWGLRDYGIEGQLGLEKTPEEYVEKVVAIFREVRRVLRNDGTLWLNLGDSYAGGGRAGKGGVQIWGGIESTNQKRVYGAPTEKIKGLKTKDLVGIPWRVAFALQADGWYLRQDIIWHKPNPMPESVRDRCTKAHEYIFLLSKSERYYYNADAIAEQANPLYKSRYKTPFYTGIKESSGSGRPNGASNTGGMKEYRGYRNRRSVWTVTTKPYKGAHFATFPPDLVEPCILAGCPMGGNVLDPFAGSGTVLGVAEKNLRDSVGIELNPEYCSLIEQRVQSIVGSK